MHVGRTLDGGSSGDICERNPRSVVVSTNRCSNNGNVNRLSHPMGSIDCMTSDPDRTLCRSNSRSVAAARSAGREAVAMLAEAERLRARAVASLVDFDAIDAHVADGFATPQRHLVVKGKVVDREADRLWRIIRFCADHTLVADAMEAGEITVDHADALRRAAHAAGVSRFDDGLLDLLAAARNVDFAVFARRLEVWSWRIRPTQTDDEVEIGRASCRERV